MRAWRDWSVAGLVAGLAGFATSYLAAMTLTLRDSPVSAVGQMIIRITPGTVAEHAIKLLGSHDKTVLVGVIFVLLCAFCALAGVLALYRWWAAWVVFAVLAAVGALAVSLQSGLSAIDFAPLAVGFVTWLLVLALLAAALRRTPQPAGPGSTGGTPSTRRGFLVRAGVVAAVAVAVSGVGKVIGAGRRHVEESRRLLRLPHVTPPRVPARARVGLRGIASWQTSEDRFYRVHTAITVPTIEPHEWRLRIHGMVDRPITLTYGDLLRRRTTEAWVTLNCVSNPVGGPLIGNAWWSGVRVADLLDEVGVHGIANAVLQTSDDGWTCGTPLEALTDGRDAMLAVAMNGSPLPIEHGFPVRTIVPGLYGYVSACKWVVDLEVTRFDRFTAYWTQRGWSEQGPVKLASRIDVPRAGDDVPAGDLRVGGVAWEQHTGIRAVEVSLDGGAWQQAQVAPGPTDDTWVQWAATVHAGPGDHVLRVRATDKTGQVQTGVVRDTVPDGATGWHTVEFSAKA